MTDNIMEVVIQLRKDTVANYELVGNNFIPENGEICIVEYGDRLRFKCGDGLHYFNQLEYIDENSGIIFYGYYLNGKFWTDSTYTVELEKSTAYLYIDRIVAGQMYTWDGTKYNPAVPAASETVAGIMKLYQDGGSNIDGAMSQKAVTQGVGSIGFAIDPDKDDCLIVDLPWDNIQGRYPN